jgi:hypothetical protein
MLFVVVIAHKYVEAIENRLPHSPYISDIRRTWSNAGLLGKVMRSGIIAMIFLMPKMHAKRGLIDAQEVSALPQRYKYLLTVPLIACCVLFIALLTLRAAE